MGAPELLHNLRGAGLVLTLMPAGGLRVAPRNALTDDLRTAIRAERDALVLALQAEEAKPEPQALSARQGQLESDEGSDREVFEERAAILEFEAGMSRAAAEGMAREGLPREREVGKAMPDSSARVGRTCDGCAHRLPRGTCAEPVAAGLIPSGFSIVWPLARHGATCSAYTPKPVAPTPDWPW